ncbi:DUF4168 domain-containing protein [Flavisphingomonas formosensis]|uniref:DUF4168 domain-containing protein n=1 Tax=Flavisphingomonas formosensis TaxID=861534 RepID=UPI0018E018A4|nr:DUF4168 domain-containing protein [Sphingomonas formosensis]
MVSVRQSLAVVALFTAFAAPAVQASDLGTSAKTGAPTLTAQQIRDYALALGEIQTIRKAVADAPADQRPLMAAQAKTAIAAALERRGMDVISFNTISAEVEREHGLRSQVRQIMMQGVMGGMTDSQ